MHVIHIYPVTANMHCQKKAIYIIYCWLLPLPKNNFHCCYEQHPLLSRISIGRRLSHFMVADNCLLAASVLLKYIHWRVSHLGCSLSNRPWLCLLFKPDRWMEVGRTAASIPNITTNNEAHVTPVVLSSPLCCGDTPLSSSASSAAKGVG